MRHIEKSISNKNISIVIDFKPWLPFGKSHLFNFTKSVVFPCRNFSFNSFTLRSALKLQCKQSDSKNHHDELQINSWFYILPKNEVVYVVDPFILSVNAEWMFRLYGYAHMVPDKFSSQGTVQYFRSVHWKLANQVEFWFLSVALSSAHAQCKTWTNPKWRFAAELPLIHATMPWL